MAGFGKTLARAVAGGLKGYGDYLQQEGASRAKEASDERTLRRQMALAEFEDAIKDENATVANTRARENTILTGQINAASAQGEIKLRAGVKAVEDTREFQIWRQKQGIQLTNDKALALYKTEVETAAAAKKDGLTKVDDTIDAETGTKVLTFKDPQGNLTTYDTGIVVQQKAEVDPLTGKKLEAPAPSRSSTPGWRAGGAGTSTTSRAKTYTQAQLEETARNRGTTVENVERAMQAVGYTRKD